MTQGRAVVTHVPNEAGTAAQSCSQVRSVRRTVLPLQDAAPMRLAVEFVTTTNHTQSTRHDGRLRFTSSRTIPCAAHLILSRARRLAHARRHQPTAWADLPRLREAKPRRHARPRRHRVAGRVFPADGSSTRAKRARGGGWYQQGEGGQSDHGDDDDNGTPATWAGRQHRRAGGCAL